MEDHFRAFSEWHSPFECIEYGYYFHPSHEDLPPYPSEQKSLTGSPVSPRSGEKKVTQWRWFQCSAIAEPLWSRLFHNREILYSKGLSTPSCQALGLRC
jgi:hypothetical protein